jgi:hypothetical protein
MSRGSRESDWLVVRRCFAIIRRVQRGPTDWRGLVEAVLEQVGPDAYGHTEGASLRKRFYNDLHHIRHSLYLDLRAAPDTKEYAFYDVDAQPLLELPEGDLATIAWLEHTFQPNSPHFKEVQTLLDRLKFYLPATRRQTIEEYRLGLTLELGQMDEDILDPEVELGLREALFRRRRVEFDYLSPSHEDRLSRRHTVDIYEPPFFDPALGHYYVRGWCHCIVGPNGTFVPHGYTSYRQGRISNLCLLPDKLPPSPPPPKQYPVIYTLSARVARGGVTRRRWIEFERVENHPDGSATVYGFTDNIFFAGQELMHYRDNCRVLGGPQVLEWMSCEVAKLAQLYASDTHRCG